MRKLYVSTLLLLLVPLHIGAQQADAQTSERVRPTVTFASGHATALEMIKAIAQQTCVPVGIVPGRNPGALESERRAYDVQKVPVEQALQQVVSDIGYRVERKEGVYVLTAYDATAQQLDLLQHRFEKFGGSKTELQMLQADLSNWMGITVEPGTGYAASILTSPADERLSLPVMRNASVEEIADRIVTLGSKGMWKANIAADDRLEFSNVEIEFTSYQHYACGSQPSSH